MPKFGGVMASTGHGTPRDERPGLRTQESMYNMFEFEYTFQAHNSAGYLKTFNAFQTLSFKFVV